MIWEVLLRQFSYDETSRLPTFAYCAFMFDVCNHHVFDTINRLLGLLENFLSTVKWLEYNVTYIAKNIEMDLRYITFIDHDRGASFVPFVSEH